MSGMTDQDITALNDLLVGVEMDRHSLPDGNAKVEALGRAIARLRGDGEPGQAVRALPTEWTDEAAHAFRKKADAVGAHWHSWPERFRAGMRAALSTQQHKETGA